MSKKKSIGKMLTVMALAWMLLVLSPGVSLASQPLSADENEPHGCSACQERQSARQIDDDIPTYSNEPQTELVGAAPSPAALRTDARAVGRHIRTRIKLPGKATLISPKGTIGTGDPTYLWRCVPGATQYLLKVANANTPNTAIIETWYDAAAVVSNQGCSIKPGVILAAGDYRWWIQAKNSRGTGPLSYYNSFRFTNVKPGNVTPISPRGLISTRRPTFIWTAISSATQYNLEVSDSDGVVVFSESYLAEDVTSGTRAIARSPTILSGGIYFWRVQASNGAGDGSWSGYKYFEIVCGSRASQPERQSGRERRSVARPSRGS